MRQAWSDERRKLEAVQSRAKARAVAEEQGDDDAAEPLGWPRGSVRALVALTLAASCWVRVLLALPVPAALLSLLLTVLGYYFGFRRRRRTATTGPDEVGAKAKPAAGDTPLSLPRGYVRWILLLGFGVSGGVLAWRGRLTDFKYAEFFLILAGLIGGWLFALLTEPIRDGSIGRAIDNIKAVVVLVVAAGLAAVFLVGWWEQLPPIAVVAGCAVVSFYYGSR